MKTTLYRPAVRFAAGCLAFGLLAAAARGQNAVAPQVAAVGPASSVPMAVQNLRWHMNDAEINALTFRSMHSLFTTRAVTRSGSVLRLPREDHDLNFNYTFEGEEYTADEVLDRTYTNAMLIMKDGVVVYENYLNNSEAQTHFMGWSMTKSLVSILVGAAHEAGLIKSLDDDITRYLPELSEGAYKGVSVRQVLQMRSGVDYEENYDFSAPGLAARNHIMALVKNVSRFVDPARTIKRAHAPGEVFAYKTIDTAVLGLLLERVTGMYLADYMQTTLWEPMGAESDGFYIMDGAPGVGREFSGAGFNAVLRDFARIGLMMLNEGQVNGHQVISPAWVAESTRPAGDEKAPLDYGYQWWTVSNTEAYSAIGLQGQYIFVDPESRTVIVKLSYFPPNDPEETASRETFSFFEAAARWRPE
ncbi:serine hydrolase [Parahaliea maris]|uniref:Serine hydrolase n=1 Tax=Parahaliea maris TaxID=2716870 RepID=A0A5C8ZTW3_9GAMM|nr:serine hydrolase [Parahaliea maris]TXS91896.1 serine hydrolase [Parahaliea maris]